MLKIAQAKLFIKALLDDFAQFQEVIKDVSVYLAPLVCLNLFKVFFKFKKIPMTLFRMKSI